MGAMYHSSAEQTQTPAKLAAIRYRWTWPYVPDAPDLVGPGYAVELPIYAVLLAVFAIPVVQDATGVSLHEMITILAIHATWFVAGRWLARRVLQSRRAFDVIVIGNCSLSTGLATAIAIVGGEPATVLWGPLILYATANGGIRDFAPSIALQLIHVAGPLATIPWFVSHDASAWAVGGPVLAAAFAAIGYHLLATQTARSRGYREAVEARLAQLEREAAEGRLARDLHDVVGSALSTVKVYADLLARSNAAIAAPLSDVASAGLDDLRAVIDALAPPGEGGIESTLGAIGRRVAPCGIDVRVGGTWPQQLPGPTRVAVARIVQEAVCNAMKHGKATEMTIDGSSSSGWLELSVRDNGSGFDATLASAASHGVAAGAYGRGLATMQARAIELGGTFAVEAKPGTGTQIVVTVPA